MQEDIVRENNILTLSRVAKTPSQHCGVCKHLSANMHEQGRWCGCRGYANRLQILFVTAKVKLSLLKEGACLKAVGCSLLL